MRFRGARYATVLGMILTGYYHVHAQAWDVPFKPLLVQKAGQTVVAVSSCPVPSAPGAAGDLRERASDIFVTCSAAQTAEWSKPIPVTSSGTSAGVANTAARLANNQRGAWVTVWVAQLAGQDTQDILFSRSEDDGVSWSSPKPLASNVRLFNPDEPAISLQFVSQCGLWLLLWQSEADEARDAQVDVAFATAREDGAEWSAARPLLDSKAVVTANEVLPVISAPPGGSVEARWYSFSPGDTSMIWNCVRAERVAETLRWTETVADPFGANMANLSGLRDLRDQFQAAIDRHAAAAAGPGGRGGQLASVESRYLYAGSAALLFYAAVGAWFVLKWYRGRSVEEVVFESEASTV